MATLALHDELHGDFNDPPEHIAVGDMLTYAIKGVVRRKLKEVTLVNGHLWIHDGPLDAEFDDVWLHDPTAGQAEHYSLPPTVSGTHRLLRQTRLPGRDRPPVLIYQSLYRLTKPQLLARLALFENNDAEERWELFRANYEKIRNPKGRIIFIMPRLLGSAALAAA